MRIALVLVATLATTASASPRVALLEPEVAPPGMTPPEEPPPPAPITSLQLAQSRDAASDRGFLISSAITIPKGSVAASARYATSGGFTGAMVNVGAGLSRDLEVSADFGQSFRSYSRTYGAALKLVAIRRSGWALALEGGYRDLFDSTDSSNRHVPYYTAGARITGCFEATCSVLGTFGIDGIGFSNIDADGGSRSKLLVLPVLSGSVMFGTGAVRPFVEGLVSFGALGIMGVRFSWKSTAIDLGVGGGAAAGGGGASSANALIGLTFRP